MNKKVWFVILLVVAIVVVAFGVKHLFMNDDDAPPVFDPLNATYRIEGQPVTLINGKAQMAAAPGSASQITTTIFGEPVVGDLNDDGRADAAVMLVQDTGGSGTFYYIAAAIGTPGQGAVGTNAVFLGDRIAPQNVEIKNGQIIVNYADRAPNDPMSVQPSIGKSMYLTLEGTDLVTSTPLAGVGAHCGGNMVGAPTCASGSHCAPDPSSHLPFGDVGGICVAD